MPKFDFSFSGHIEGAWITRATDNAGRSVDVSGMPASELRRKLNNGELSISLADYLYDSDNVEMEINDFWPSNVWPDEA